MPTYIEALAGLLTKHGAWGIIALGVCALLFACAGVVAAYGGLLVAQKARSMMPFRRAQDREEFERNRTADDERILRIDGPHHGVDDACARLALLEARHAELRARVEEVCVDGTKDLESLAVDLRRDFDRLSRRVDEKADKSTVDGALGIGNERFQLVAERLVSLERELRARRAGGGTT